MPISADCAVGLKIALTTIASLSLLPACNDDRRERASPAVTAIHVVQGDAYASPLEGQQVTISGVVTGDFQDNDANASANLGGFFVQEETPDDNPATSEGIFVFDGPGQVADVLVGYRVLVEGTIIEYFGETQLKASRVTRTGTGNIVPADLEFPDEVIVNVDGKLIADLERFEGMFVRVPGNLYVSDLSRLERYGEILLSSGQRLHQFTNFHEPDMAGLIAHEESIARRSLLLDDGIAAQNPNLSRFPVAAGQIPIRAGVLASGLSGNVRFSRASGSVGDEAYRLEPSTAVQFIDINPRAAVPPDVGGEVTVASFNVLNFFTSIDSGEPVCGPAGDADCRGADNNLEFARQRMKTVRTIAKLGAHIVGIMEIENNAGAALANLVLGLNGENGDWAYVDTGVIGTDAIAVGLIYQSGIVTPSGRFAVLDGSVDARFDAAKNRPTLAQTFRVKESGAQFTVVVNHLKSKGSDCNDLGDPDLKDGQGNCNLTRTRAVEAMIDWLANDPTGSDDPDVLIIGDLNAYLLEDPVRVLEAAGFVNLLHDGVSGVPHYTYVFKGQAGALDHALASPLLAKQVSGAAAWHINADEAPLFDYNLEFGRSPALFDAASPYRASDHDPVIVGIDPL